VESGLVASLDDEQRVRYYVWWRKYLVLKYASRIAFLILLLFSILQFRFHTSAQQYLYAPLLLSAFFLTMWWGLLDCPRCGEQFSSGKLKNYLGDECQYCGLSYLQLSAVGKPRRLQ
jgi:hypothetical protein